MDVRLLAEIIGATLALWALSCLAMVLFARRLPPGLLKDIAEFLPACVTTARRLRGNPAVPRRARVALLIAILWVLSPIDLLPEFLPVIGPLDDVVAVVFLLRYAARAIPSEVLLAAWPAEPRLLTRLLGTTTPRRGCVSSTRSSPRFPRHSRSSWSPDATPVRCT